MIYIVSGTNRPGSNSLKVAKQMHGYYNALDVENEIIDLQDYPQNELDGSQYSENKPQKLIELNKKILDSDGLCVVVPEYNGSLPGILKTFIDHLEYPAAFYHRPVCFIGLGGMFGGLRPVEHAQQIFGYRNAFIYPDRVFLINVWKMMQNDQVMDEMAVKLMKDQTKGFSDFVKGLCDTHLHAKHSG
tara:strand:- start:4427 stop:4990 length:564 start_codon:yes stop_codon:yes gene_type:complete